MNLNDSLYLADIKLPAGVTISALAHGRNPPVVSIHAPRAAEPEPTAEAAAAAEGARGRGAGGCGRGEEGRGQEGRAQEGRGQEGRRQEVARARRDSGTGRPRAARVLRSSAGGACRGKRPSSSSSASAIRARNTSARATTPGFWFVDELRGGIGARLEARVAPPVRAGACRASTAWSCGCMKPLTFMNRSGAAVAVGGALSTASARRRCWWCTTRSTCRRARRG